MSTTENDRLSENVTLHRISERDYRERLVGIKESLLQQLASANSDSFDYASSTRPIRADILRIDKELKRISL